MKRSQKHKTNKKQDQMMTNGTAAKQEQQLNHAVTSKKKLVSFQSTDESVLSHIHANLDQIEKNVALFSFAIKEIEDITSDLN